MEDNMKRNGEIPCDNGQRDWTVKNLPAMKENWIQSLGWENPLEKEMATHSSTFVWGNPMDRGAWRAEVHRVAKGWTWLKQLSTHSKGCQRPDSQYLQLCELQGVCCEHSTQLLSQEQSQIRCKQWVLVCFNKGLSSKTGCGPGLAWG